MYKKEFQAAILFLCFRLLNKNELQTIPDGTFRNSSDLRLVYVSDLKQARSDCRIDLFHNSSQIKYYFFSNANKPRNDEQISKEYIYIYIINSRLRRGIWTTDCMSENMVRPGIEPGSPDY